MFLFIFLAESTESKHSGIIKASLLKWDGDQAYVVDM